jgi:hypothetical protein
MNNFKKITYSLLAIASFILVSASAQAGGISINIGGFGYGSHHGYNSHYQPAYSHYRSPVVTYRHHYKPRHGNHHNSYYGNYGHRDYYQKKYYSGHHGGRYQSAYRNNNHYSSHNSVGVTSRNKHRR